MTYVGLRDEIANPTAPHLLRYNRAHSKIRNPLCAQIIDQISPVSF